MHVFGLTSIKTMNRINELYRKYFKGSPNAKRIFVSPEEASFVKYGINSFLATKVAWLNQFKQIIDSYSQATGETFDYDTVISAMLNDERIGESHTKVPGIDGKLGFGGACFTKDTSAFLEFSKNQTKEFTILGEAIKSNNKIRNQYELDSREK